MRKFPCKQDENHLTTVDALPLIYSSHRGILVHPQRTYSFMPQLPEQLSSAIQPGPATLVNGIQCPLRDKILLHPRVSPRHPLATSRTVVLNALHNFSVFPKGPRPPQLPTQPACKLLSYPLILELTNIQPRLGWYHSPRFKLQLQSCEHKPVVGIEELSTPVDTAVLDHLPANINEHMVNLLCHTTSIGISSPAISLWVLIS